MLIIRDTTLRNMQKLDHCNLPEAIRWMQMEPTLPFRSIDCFWLKLRAFLRCQQRKEGASNLSAMANVVKDGIRTHKSYVFLIKEHTEFGTVLQITVYYAEFVYFSLFLRVQVWTQFEDMLSRLWCLNLLKGIMKQRCYFF